MITEFDVAENMLSLPRIAMTFLETENIAGLIHRGTHGYTPFPAIRDQAGVDAFNARHDVSPAAAEAMLVGSMFGWDVPGAVIANCERIAA